ncbi:MAG: MFS transporter, partial [Chloroflexi bacterium]
AGALVPVSMALIGDVFPAQQRAVPLGIIAGVDTAGWVLGHLYGGVMVQYFAWPVLFWLNVPLAGAALLVLARWLPAGRPQPRGMRFDWGGALLVSLMLVALNLALNTGADAAPGSPMPTVAAAFSPGWLLVAGGALLAFVLVEWRSAQPLLNLGAFRNRAFSAATLLNLLLGFCLMVGLVSVPLYINTVTTIMQRLEPQRAALLTGYLLSAFTLPMALAAIGGGWVAQRAGNRAAALLGCALGAAGLLAMSRWQVQHSAAIHALFTQGPRGLLGQAQLQQGAAFVAGSLLLAGSGLGLTLAPITTTVVDAVPEGERGSAAALVIIMRLIGMSVSVSAMTTYGLERSHALLLAGTAGMQLADFAAQVQVLVNSTTQVIDEMALIAALVCALALPIAAALQRRTAPGTAE